MEWALSDHGEPLDTIEVRGISARGHHGVTAAERAAGQDFLADIALHLDTRAAAATDNIAYTVDYAQVSRQVADLLAGEPLHLLETLAQNIADIVLEHQGVRTADVVVHKPDAPIGVSFSDVLLRIRRTAGEQPAALPGEVPLPPLPDYGHESSFRPRPRPRPQHRSGPEPVVSEQGGARDFSAEPHDEHAASYGEHSAPYPERTAFPELYRRSGSRLRAHPTSGPKPVVGVRAPVPPPPPPPPSVPLPPVPSPPSASMALPWARPGWMSAAGETSVFGHLASGGETARSTDPAAAAEAPGSTALSASGETSVFGDMPRFGETSGRSDGSRFGETSYGEPPSFGEISRSGMHDAGTHVPTPPPRSHAVFERPVLGLPPAGRGREWRELKPPSGLLDQIAEIGPAPENLPQVPAVQPKGPIAIVSSMDERPHRPVDAILSLGANLGDALWSLRSAIEDLRRTDGIVVDAVSPLARSAPMGPVEQGDYFNAVVQIRTNLSARELLHVVQQIEDRHGRSREQRWGPRTLDIDVVTYDTLLDVDDELELPHPGAHRRAFVLVPWAAFSPDAFLPGLGGGNVSILAERAPDRDGIRWLALGWETGTIATSGAVPKAAASAF